MKFAIVVEVNTHEKVLYRQRIEMTPQKLGMEFMAAATELKYLQC